MLTAFVSVTALIFSLTTLTTCSQSAPQINAGGCNILCFGIESQNFPLRPECETPPPPPDEREELFDCVCIFTLVLVM